jgi:hypothetical protein
MAVTAVALLIVAGAFMIVIAKTWKSHCRGESISIDDLVAEDALRRQKPPATVNRSAGSSPATSCPPLRL